MTKKKRWSESDNKKLLKRLGGSQFDAFNNLVTNQALAAQWSGNIGSAEERDQLLLATLEAMRGVAPQNEIEGMLATQMVAVHAATMECFRRAMNREQTFDARQLNLSFANKLSRTFTMQMDALQRYRGKGEQVMCVEHVTVNAGGQAIVGTVTGGGGVQKKTEEQPHAKQIESQPSTYAPMPPLPCADAARETVPITRDAKR